MRAPPVQVVLSHKRNILFSQEGHTPSQVGIPVAAAISGSSSESISSGGMLVESGNEQAVVEAVVEDPAENVQLHDANLTDHLVSGDENDVGHAQAHAHADSKLEQLLGLEAKIQSGDESVPRKVVRYVNEVDEDLCRGRGGLMKPLPVDWEARHVFELLWPGSIQESVQKMNKAGERKL